MRQQLVPPLIFLIAMYAVPSNAGGLIGSLVEDLCRDCGLGRELDAAHEALENSANRYNEYTGKGTTNPGASMSESDSYADKLNENLVSETNACFTVEGACGLEVTLIVGTRCFCDHSGRIVIGTAQ